MPKNFLCLVLLLTVFSIIGINTGELTYLLNRGNTVCPSCIGVG